MAPRKRSRKSGARNGRNGNGRATKLRVTNRQNMNTKSNGLSNSGAIRRPMINRTFVESGSDFLGPLTIKANPATAGDRILLSNSVSPSLYPGTRMSQLSQLWERYRFRTFRLRWVPAVPKTLACQLIIYQDTDPLDDPTIITDADALIRQATAQTGSQQFNFINSMIIDLAQRSDKQLYYTGLDKQNDRFNRQGNFYVIQVTNPLNFNGEPLTEDIMAGSLYVDWTCEFQIAQINPIAAMAPTVHTGYIDIDAPGVVYPLGSTSAGSIVLTEPTFLSIANLSGVQDNTTQAVAITLGTDILAIGTLSKDSQVVSQLYTRSGADHVYSPGTYPLKFSVVLDQFKVSSTTAIVWCNASGIPPVYTP
jgi:hypothetical protein